jgi:hypothetical protein
VTELAQNLETVMGSVLNVFNFNFLVPESCFGGMLATVQSRPFCLPFYLKTILKVERYKIKL